MIKFIAKKGIFTFYTPETTMRSARYLFAFKINRKWRWHHARTDQGGGQTMRNGFFGPVWYCINVIC